MPSKAKPPEGEPHPDHVVEVRKFVSPKGRKYIIRKTTEVDATDKAAKPKKP